MLEQALDAAGAPPGVVTIEEGEGALAVGLNPDYVSELAGSGDLGSDPAFDSVLSELEGDQGAFFVSFEGDWLSALRGQLPRRGDREDPGEHRAAAGDGLLDHGRRERLLLHVRVTTD